MKGDKIGKVLNIIIVVLSVMVMVMGVKGYKDFREDNEFRGNKVLLMTLETRDGRKSTPDYIFEGIGDKYKGAEIYKEKVKGEVGEVASLIDKYEPNIIIGLDQGSVGIKVYNSGYLRKGKVDFNTNEDMIKYNLELNKFKKVEVTGLQFGHYFNTFMMDIREGASLRNRKIVYGGISVPLIQEQVSGSGKVTYDARDMVDLMKITIESAIIEQQLEER